VTPEPTRWTEPVWLEPYPDTLVERIEDLVPGPDARYRPKESLTLAFVIALQQLPPLLRAVVVLRDVLGFRAAEVAQIVDGTTGSVGSALVRARAELDRRRAAGAAQHAPPPEASRERELVQRFADAFEDDDIDAVVALLTDDARLTMPPAPLEYQGHAAIAGFLHDRCRRRVGGGFRLVRTGANQQPAFGCYLKDALSPIARAHGLIVLTLDDDHISAITCFLDNSVYPLFGLPRTLRLAR
jgi:RNA polymerase sigma-70 factor (TIGR02960 family)